MDEQCAVDGGDSLTDCLTVLDFSWGDEFIKLETQFLHIDAERRPVGYNLKLEGCNLQAFCMAYKVGTTVCFFLSFTMYMPQSTEHVDSNQIPILHKSELFSREND